MTFIWHYLAISYLLSFDVATTLVEKYTFYVDDDGDHVDISEAYDCSVYDNDSLDINVQTKDEEAE